MGKSRNGKIATGLTIAAFFFVTIAYFTPNWLVTDGQLKHPKFEKIGLWVVCFKGFQDARHWYDTEFCHCWWVFEEEFYIIFDILLPGFYVATQFFFSLTFLGLFFACICILFYLCSSRHNDHFITLLIVIGVTSAASALTGSLALLIFGYNGDARVWMPNWEHNDIGYSYALGVIGVICAYLAGGLFLVEARAHKFKRERIMGGGRRGMGADDEYGMEQRGGRGEHTEI
ncbi:hypothetical protein LSTR_LSTR009477 [Laodelphax striatellus]|uniref:Uncharacterized protein n=1 Tax=Laodelphax striatellus TaxID=195883 RepID=A0A482WFK8_LAOST|nr:hypothetical protein LSTR_LSTR009477 [Laodelphax striatellus]